MSDLGFTDAGFALLDELALNNSRAWYQDNKNALDDLCLTPFAMLLEALSECLQDEGLAFSGSRKTMFRMYRDVRFCKLTAPV